MNRLPYRVTVRLVCGEWVVTCWDPAYSTTALAKDYLAKDYDDAQDMANYHARTCDLLRAANAAHVHPCPNCAELPAAERRDCVVCLGRGWLSKEPHV